MAGETCLVNIQLVEVEKEKEIDLELVGLPSEEQPSFLRMMMSTQIIV